MNDKLKQQLLSCSELPTLPSIALKIIDLANKPDTDMSKVCQLISLDPALAAKILEAVNSPLYGSRHIVGSLRHATSILGTQTITTIALSFSLATSLIKHPGGYHHTFDNNLFWRHSIASALACRALGKETRVKIAAGDLFLAGLLQNIGMLAFITVIPEKYGSIIASTLNHDSLLKTERDLFGIGHDELGYALLKKWNLPDYICIACLDSHKRPTSKEIGVSISAHMAIAHYVADYFLDPQQNTNQTAKLIEVAKSWLDLDVGELVDVIDTMASGLSSIEGLFEVKIHHQEDITHILSEAKEVLDKHIDSPS